MNDMATISPTTTPLWDALGRAIGRAVPDVAAHAASSSSASPTRGSTGRWGRSSYGAGLFSPTLDRGEYATRFHGNDERVDVESLALTTQLWLDVVKELWA